MQGFALEKAIAKKFKCSWMATDGFSSLTLQKPSSTLCIDSLWDGCPYEMDYLDMIDRNKQ